MRDAVKLPYSSGKWHELWEVPSESRPDVSYVIGKTIKAEWGCSCPQWTFHTPRRDCKHIVHVKNQVARNLYTKTYTEFEVMAKPSIQKAVSRFALVEV